MGALKTVNELQSNAIDWNTDRYTTELNQKAKLADIGATPDPIKQVGSDLLFDSKDKQITVYLNHYKIDSLSYNTIAKIYERIGYQVNLYDSLNVNNRKGWNFIKLNSFDFNPDFDIMTSQENSIRKIFLEGITLLHDKTYLTSGHNYETIIG